MTNEAGEGDDNVAGKLRPSEVGKRKTISSAQRKTDESKERGKRDMGKVSGLGLGLGLVKEDSIYIVRLGQITPTSL